MTMPSMQTAKDPVCGMDVNARTASQKSNHMGQTYYFCSQGCKETFDKSPVQYIAGHGDMGHGGHH